MLDLDLATILFQIANFLVLTVLLYKFLFQPVMQTVQKRADEKRRLAMEMTAEREAASKLRTDLEEQLTHLDEEAETMLAEARVRAEREREALLRDAYAEAEHVLVEAQAEAKRAQQQAMADFHQDLLDSILDISRHVIGQNAPAGVHDELVQHLNDRIWELGQREMRRVESIRRSLGERTPTVHATSARPLSHEQQAQLVRTFSALADRTVHLELETDPALAAGIYVRIGDLVVDNSIAAQLNDVRDDVADMLAEQPTDA